MTEQVPDDRTPIGKIFDVVARTGYNMPFREKFLADPRAAFAEEGVVIPPEIEIKLLMDEPNLFHVVVPEFDDQPEEIGPDHPLSWYAGEKA